MRRLNKRSKKAAWKLPISSEELQLLLQIGKEHPRKVRVWSRLARADKPMRTFFSFGGVEDTYFFLLNDEGRLITEVKRGSMSVRNGTWREEGGETVKEALIRVRRDTPEGWSKTLILYCWRQDSGARSDSLFRLPKFPVRR